MPGFTICFCYVNVDLMPNLHRLTFIFATEVDKQSTTIVFYCGTFPLYMGCFKLSLKIRYPHGAVTVMPQLWVNGNFHDADFWVPKNRLEDGFPQRRKYYSKQEYIIASKLLKL